ncbi:MAG: transcriptional repressor [Phycisphaerae bacterium]
MIKNNKTDLINSFRAKCKKHRLSMTPQRMAIYELLIETTDHPSSEEVYEKAKRKFRDISLDTVYRTLTTFSDIGVINTVEGYGEAKRYDPEIEPHHHFRCKNCNNIIDFCNTTYDNLEIPREFRKNFKITNLRVVLEGVCEKCGKNR